MSYQTAPVGARSKPTTTAIDDFMQLPDCPCGGEIKTDSARRGRRGRRYQTAPVGARSKREHREESHGDAATRLPLWGRDQNYRAHLIERGILLPDCPCGGEIKTHLCGVVLREPGYQTAPVGARSKHYGNPIAMQTWATRLPLWGRDQNSVGACIVPRYALPDCPCGGEIKTQSPRRVDGLTCYQTAPVGARSKPKIRAQCGRR